MDLSAFKEFVVRDCSSVDYVTGGGIQLSIIIVSYNTKDVTDECLASIYAAKWRDKFEVIVVDNNSQDGSVEMIREKYPQVKLIANPNNRLFAIANNQGAKIATGKYLLLLNSDTIVYDDNLQRMIDYYDKLPNDVICMGPKILNHDKSFQSGPHPRWGTLVEHFLHLIHATRILHQLKHVFPTLPVENNRVQQTGWVAGCAMMIKRELYNKVGGLNEAIEFYGEEPEFGFRTYRLGYRTIYYPEAEIIHLGGCSTQNNNRLDKEVTEQRIATDRRRFDKLVMQTCGRKKAIQIAQITKIAYAILRTVSSNKDYFSTAIVKENEVIDFLRKQESLSSPHY